jgi:phytoene dehydrogenase-like protein
VEQTAAALGVDGRAYKRMMQPLVDHWESLIDEFLRPVHVPKHPFQMAMFGIEAMRPAQSFASARFQTEQACALFGGFAAHSILPLSKPFSAAFGLVLGLLAHAVGWPIPRRGSQSITDALCGYLRALGGDVVSGRRVDNVDEFTGVRAIVCDVTPRQLLALAGHRFTPSFNRALERYRYGPGVFKVDWALDRPIPWKAASCGEAATVHIGGSLAKIAASEEGAWTGAYVERPFIILAQPSLFDPTRAPQGQHTAWGYCHVPNGSRETMINEVEQQIERFAPGFRRIILARHMFTAASMEQHNPNLVGGDINGGAQDFGQLFIRPTRKLYRTPAKDIYICSASTPPGGGVHGMCGYNAAKAVLKDL